MTMTHVQADVLVSNKVNIPKRKHACTGILINVTLNRGFIFFLITSVQADVDCNSLSWKLMAMHKVKINIKNKNMYRIDLYLR